MKLLTTTNPKLIKGEKSGYLTAALHLAPFNLSGFQVCPKASKGCASACLNTAGRGRFDNVQNARINRTKFLFNDRKNFIEQLKKEIALFVKSARKKGFIPCIRLNATSDLSWEDMSDVIQNFPDVQFYDYTAIAKRVERWVSGNMPDNYHLTFSRKETKANHADVEKLAKLGANIAVVFSSENLPDTYLGLPVIDGDKTDLRFTDPRGVIVGLKAKGKAKKDTSGFVVQID